MKQLSLIFLLLGGLAMAQAGEIYKWVDAEGKVHYGDREQGSSARQMNVPAAPPPDPQLQERLERQRRLLDARSQDRADERESQEKARQERAQREKQCADARNRLSEYDNAQALYRDDGKGERVYLDNTQRQQVVDGLRAEIKRYCK